MSNGLIYRELEKCYKTPLPFLSALMERTFAEVDASRIKSLRYHSLNSGKETFAASAASPEGVLAGTDDPQPILFGSSARRVKKKTVNRLQPSKRETSRKKQSL